MSTDDRGRGRDALWLSFGIGSLLGLVAVAARMLFVPYRVHRRQ